MRLRNVPSKWKGRSPRRRLTLVMLVSLIAVGFYLALFLPRDGNESRPTTTAKAEDKQQVSTTEQQKSQKVVAPLATKSERDEAVAMGGSSDSGDGKVASGQYALPWGAALPADQLPPSLKLQGKERGPSWPFVTGDGFRYEADFIVDETTGGPTEIDKVTTAIAKRSCSTVSFVDANGADDTDNKTVVLFVQTHYIDKFVEAWKRALLREKNSKQGEEVAAAVLLFPSSTKLTAAEEQAALMMKAQYSCRVVLTTHNSDYSAPYEAGNTLFQPQEGEKASAYQLHREWILDNPTQFVAWYAQNPSVLHPRLFPLPIGIENRYNRYGPHMDVYREQAAGAVPLQQRQKWLLVSFSLKTNKKERAGAMAAVSGPEWTTNETLRTLLSKFPSKKKSTDGSPSLNHRDTLKEFLSVARDHKFVLAPRGHGIDTHRLWEALYMGCIPVTRRSTLDPLLERLPVLLVEDYSEVTPARLVSAEQELGPMFGDPDVTKWLRMREGWVKELRRHA